MKSNLCCSMDYSLFTSMNNEDYSMLFIADTLIHDCDDYAINWNSAWLNYWGFFLLPLMMKTIIVPSLQSSWYSSLSLPCSCITLDVWMWILPPDSASLLLCFFSLLVYTLSVPLFPSVCVCVWSFLQSWVDGLSEFPFCVCSRDLFVERRTCGSGLSHCGWHLNLLEVPLDKVKVLYLSHIQRTVKCVLCI